MPHALRILTLLVQGNLRGPDLGCVDASDIEREGTLQLSESKRIFQHISKGLYHFELSQKKLRRNFSSNLSVIFAAMLQINAGVQNVSFSHQCCRIFRCCTFQAFITNLIEADFFMKGFLKARGKGCAQI